MQMSLMLHLGLNIFNYSIQNDYATQKCDVSILQTQTHIDSDKYTTYMRYEVAQELHTCIPWSFSILKTLQSTNKCGSFIV